MKDALIGFGRMLAVAVVTSVVIIVLLSLAFSGQSRQEQQTVDEIRRAGLAQVCVLALPVDEDGRKQAQVDECLRRYGLVP